MRNDLLASLQLQLRQRPLDDGQRERIATHMRACGVASIPEGGLLFRTEDQRLHVFKLPPSAGGELTLV